MTERYSEYGGGVPDRWDAVLDVRCPECGVEPGNRCWNKLVDKPKRIPCIIRSKVVSA
jgi:hypothetical protein